MNLGIAGKHVLVIGASRGMGRAVAEALAAEGCSVYGVARESIELRTLERCGARSRACNVMDRGELSLLIETLRTSSPPDIIVHVAGGSVGIRDSLSSTDDMLKVWMANLGYAHEINRAFLPSMKAKGWGRIVHFSSNGVKLATGNVPYISAKGAVESYVRNMSRIYAPDGIVISAVSPGPIHTPGIFMYDQDEAWTKAFFAKYMPIGRWGQASEVAGAVALLCSEHASYMAGAIVPVDGGMR